MGRKHIIIFLIVIFFFFIATSIIHQNFFLYKIIKSHKILNAILIKYIIFSAISFIFFTLISIILVSIFYNNKTITTDPKLEIKNKNDYAQILDLYKSITTDTETGLLLFKHFQQFLDKELIRGKRYNTPFSITKISLINLEDKELIKKISYNIQTTLREIDIVSINSKKEIYVLLPNIKKHNAYIAMQRVLKRMSNLEDILNKKILLNIGAISFPEDGNEISELLDKLDKNIKKSQLLGYNKIVY